MKKTFALISILAISASAVLSGCGDDPAEDGIGGAGGTAETGGGPGETGGGPGETGGGPGETGGGPGETGGNGGMGAMGGMGGNS